MITAFLSLVGHVYGNFLEIIWPEAPGNYSGPFWFNSFSICLWEKLKTLISMLSGFSDVSMNHQTIYFYLSRPQDSFTHPRKPHIFEHIFVNIKSSEIENVQHFGKDGHRQLMEIRLFFNLGYGSISSREHEMDNW